MTLVPQKQAIQLVCKEIHQVARVYPLFDIAQIILAERNRSNAIFEISEKKEPLFRCKFEDAVYLTKEEALQHLLQADWRNRFVEESTVEVEPPKGNFQSVAKCGISGESLGPPNYHAYQTEIRRIHRESFSHMPFESYLSKVRTERSEEAVNEWLESMKVQTRWRILSDEESAKVTATPPQAPVTDAPQTEAPLEEPEVTAPAPEVSEAETPATEQSTEGADTSAQASDPATPTADAQLEAPAESAPEEPAELTDPTPEAEATLQVAEEAEPAETIKWFTDRAEVEHAIATEVLDKAFERTRKAKVSAAIVGKNLSPGLLVRLKGTGTHHRRHPAIIIPIVCKLLEAEHMPVFKRKGKLYTGPARPHALAADAVLAPRPNEMVTWIRENPPAKLEGLWKAVLPEGATAPPSEYAADLFWLLQQGHILLYTDDTLSVQEQPKPQQPKKPKAPKQKKPAKETSLQVQSSDSPPAEPISEPISEEASATPAAEPQPETPIADIPATNDPPTESPEPVEIVTDAIKETATVVSNSASELPAAAIAPEEPAKPISPEPSAQSESPTEEPDQENPPEATEKPSFP